MTDERGEFKDLVPKTPKEDEDKDLPKTKGYKTFVKIGDAEEKLQKKAGSSLRKGESSLTLAIKKALSKKPTKPRKSKPRKSKPRKLKPKRAKLRKLKPAKLKHRRKKKSKSKRKHNPKKYHKRKYHKKSGDIIEREVRKQRSKFI